MDPPKAIENERMFCCKTGGINILVKYVRKASRSDSSSEQTGLLNSHAARQIGTGTL